MDQEERRKAGLAANVSVLPIDAEVISMALESYQHEMIFHLEKVTDDEAKRITQLHLDTSNKWLERLRPLL